MTDRALAKIVVITSIILMQIHSIQFWQQYDSLFGWAWSLALEVCMLWLWYKNQLVVARILAAALLIAGPWYTLTAPTISTLEQVLVTQQKIESVEYRLEQKTKSLERYDNNSDKRSGWSNRIDRIQSDIDRLDTKLEVLRDKELGTGVTWRLYMVASMQATILLIVLMTQLRAVSMLRPKENAKETEKKVEIEDDDDITEPPVNNCFVCQHITDDQKGCKTTKLGNLPTFPFRKTMKCYES